ncbi:MAG: hypothetical protein WB630_04860 [Candidatus Acidiferrales bacterium]
MPDSAADRHMGVEFKQGIQAGEIMRAIGLSLAALAVLACVGFAHALPGRSKSSASLATSSATVLAAGTTICVALANSIDAKKAKPGDAITARVTLPVLSHGKVIIPNDAKITGHVTLAKTRSRDSNESQIGLLFDRAVLKDGSELPLSLTVQAIGRTVPSAAEIANQQPYNPNVATTPGIPGAAASTRRQPGLPPPPQPADPPQPARPDADSQSAQRPILDTSSHGVIGLPDLTLTESSDAASGSMVMSSKKNVKLDGGTEIILRVIGTPGDSGGATIS